MSAGMTVGTLSDIAGAQSAPSVVTVPNPPISTLDPSQWAGQILIDQGTVMEGLYGYSPTGKIVPKIATGYKVSDGGRVWTFFLRHDAKWSNGQPVTAQDFYYSWMRTASPKNTTSALWASVMSYVLNAWAYHSGAVPASKVGLKVINPYEIQLTLGAAHNIMGEMPITGSMPLYAPSVEAHPTNWYLPQYFVSDAPYTVKSFTPNGEITLVRNPDYVGAPGETNVGNVQEIDVIPAPTVIVEDYLANKVDTGIVGSASDYAYVKSHSQLLAQLHSAPDNVITYLEWDKSTIPSPLDNLKVRQAIEMAIERAPIVNSVMNGLVGETDTFGHPGWPTEAGQQPLPNNVAEAQKLLAQAGYPGGKGVPTLYLYTQTQADNPNSVSIAEALQQEFKQNLGINFQIEPLASTLYGDVVWQALNQGIKPGYVIGGGTPNWPDVTSLPMQSNQMLIWQGTVGPLWFRQYIANHFYYPKYDPTDVQMFGNPDNTKEGTTWSEWTPLIKEAQKDIAYLNAWLAKQPAAYQAVLNPPGTVPNSQVLQSYIAGYKSAKTAADKHQAWVSFWQWVGNYSTGNGNASVGLDGQVWIDQHEPRDVYLMTMYNNELNGALTDAQAVPLVLKMDNFMLQQGYGIPLFYAETYYLEMPWLTGVTPNPWSWGNFFQLQYLTTH